MPAPLRTVVPTPILPTLPEPPIDPPNALVPAGSSKRTAALFVMAPRSDEPLPCRVPALTMVGPV